MAVFDKDIGTTLQIDVGADLTTAVEVAVIAQDPNGNLHTYTAEIADTTHIRHTKTASTFNIPGIWKVQAKVKFAGGSEYYGELTRLTIEQALS